MYKSSLRLAQHFRSLPLCYPASAVSCTNTLINNETRCCCRLPTRYVATGSASQYFKDMLDNGKYNLSNALKRVGVLDLSRSRLRRNAYYMYSDIADNFDFKYFFQKFNLPDTFNSWFVVMELHLWMTLVRLMAEAEEGRFVRNIIIEAMWEDITQKTGLLGAENTSIARSQIKVMNEEFQAALLGYDEGLLSDDTVLAGALWRRFFSKDCSDPELLEILVRYVRRQVKHFDSLTRDDVLLHRKIVWFPVDDDK